MTIWQMWVDSGQGNVLIYVQFVVKMWVRRNENLHLILERTPPDKEEVLWGQMDSFEQQKKVDIHQSNDLCLQEL